MKKFQQETIDAFNNLAYAVYHLTEKLDEMDLNLAESLPQLHRRMFDISKRLDTAAAFEALRLRSDEENVKRIAFIAADMALQPPSAIPVKAKKGTSNKSHSNINAKRVHTRGHTKAR